MSAFLAERGESGGPRAKASDAVLSLLRPPSGQMLLGPQWK